jgi:hypothetical protein
MSASNPSASVLDYDAGGLQHLCLSDSSRVVIQDYSSISSRQCGKRQASFFPICHPQPTVERIATKASDVYCQL